MQQQQHQQRRLQHDWMVVMILWVVLGWGGGGAGTTDTKRPCSVVVVAFTSRVVTPIVTTNPMLNRRSTSIPSMNTIISTDTSVTYHPSGKTWIRMHPSFKTKIGASKDDQPRDDHAKSWMEAATNFEMSMIQKAPWSSSPHKDNEVVVDLQEDISMVNNNCRSSNDENKPRYTRMLSQGVATVFLVFSITCAEGFIEAQPALAVYSDPVLLQRLDDMKKEQTLQYENMKKEQTLQYENMKKEQTLQYEKTVVMFDKTNNKIDEQKNSYFWAPVASGVLSGGLSAIAAACINGYALYKSSKDVENSVDGKIKEAREQFQQMRQEVFVDALQKVNRVSDMIDLRAAWVPFGLFLAVLVLVLFQKGSMPRDQFQGMGDCHHLIREMRE